MTKETTSGSGLPATFRRQTRPLSILAAAAFIITIGAATGALGQSGSDKVPTPPTGNQQSSGDASSTRSGSGGNETIFRPKETISPGKPVSFPSDI